MEHRFRGCCSGDQPFEVMGSEYPSPPPWLRQPRSDGPARLELGATGGLGDGRLALDPHVLQDLVRAARHLGVAQAHSGSGEAPPSNATLREPGQPRTEEGSNLDSAGQLVLEDVIEAAETARRLPRQLRRCSAPVPASQFAALSCRCLGAHVRQNPGRLPPDSQSWLRATRQELPCGGCHRRTTRHVRQRLCTRSWAGCPWSAMETQSSSELRIPELAWPRRANYWDSPFRAGPRWRMPLSAVQASPLAGARHYPWSPTNWRQHASSETTEGFP